MVVLLLALSSTMFLVYVPQVIPQVKADSTFGYTQNAVWVQDASWVYMQQNILTSNLSKLVSDCVNNHIKYAFIFVGSWETGYAITYVETNATYTTVINALHAVNITVLAWVEDVDWTPDIHPANWTKINNAFLGCIQRGFDGINGDIENLIDGETAQQYVDYNNNQTIYLHTLGKLFMPDIGYARQQLYNPYLHVDAIVSMFYDVKSLFENPNAQYYWQENFGLGSYSSAGTPASPVILGIMNFNGNSHSLSWLLGQAEELMKLYPSSSIEGFSLWLYEYMGTHPDDWAQWNYWIQSNCSAPLYTLTLNSAPSGAIMTYEGGQSYAPTNEYTLNIPQTVTAASINVVSNTIYHFSNWQDNSTSNTITVSSFSSNTIFTAYYSLTQATPSSSPTIPIVLSGAAIGIAIVVVVSALTIRRKRSVRAFLFS